MLGLDAKNRFSDAQAVTSSLKSTNVIDLEVASRNLGAGEPLCVLINVDVALDGTTGDETYTIGLQTDDNAAMSSPTVLVANAVPAPARSDAAGTRYVIFLTNGLAFERYITLIYTHGGTTPTGTYSAYLIPVKDLTDYTTYADAILPK